MNAKSIVILLILAGTVAGGAAFWFSQPTTGPLMFGRVMIGPQRSDTNAVLHFIVRDNQIFVDKNQDDIPQPSELLENDRLDLITNEEAGVTYQVNEIRLGVNPEFVSETLPQQLSVTVDVSGTVTYQQIGSVVLSSSPQNVDWVQFAGPMQLVLVDNEVTLTPGAQTEVRIWVGTETIGTLSDKSSLGAASTDSQIRPASLDPSSAHETAQELNRTRKFSNLVPIPSEMVPQVRVEIETEGSPFVETLMLDDFC